MFFRSRKKFTLAPLILGLSLSLANEETTENSSETVQISVEIKNREVVGERVIRVTQGQIIELLWTTDEAAELHLHGYDIRAEISPDSPAIMSFTAHATGRFSVTSHGAGGEHGHDALMYIEVYPK